MKIKEKIGSPLFLIDMDHTIVETDSLMNQKIKEIVPPEVFLGRDTSKYWIEEIFAHAPEYHGRINEIFLQEGFFYALEPMPGAIEALHEMIDEGFAIRICTTPHPFSDFCHTEKIAWIRKHLGEEFFLRSIFTHDKTIVYGDILIDDKPEIHGLLESNPFWKHVVFDANHNKHIDTEHRLEDWSKWRDVIYPILKS